MYYLYHYRLMAMAAPKSSRDEDLNMQPDSADTLGTARLDLPSLRRRSYTPRDDVADLASLSSVELSEALSELETDEQIRELGEVCAPALVGTFSAKLDGDSSTPMLYDVTLTSSGNYAIVTDCWNHCVKAFDLRAQGCPCRSVYPMKELYPLCITSLSHPERVALTLHHEPRIVVLAIADEDEEVEASDARSCKNMLSFHSEIATKGEYRGIARLSPCHGPAADAPGTAAAADPSSERLAVTAPKEIHILSLNGSILQVVVPSLCGLPLLSDAIYVTATPSGDVVVSDVGTKRVVCVDRSGRLRWFQPFIEISHDDDLDNEDEDEHNSSCPNGTHAHADFKGIQWPLGVATDEAGRILVCDLELHSVVLLSPGGAASRLFLTETESLEYPRGLHVANGRLCLTQDHCIKVFSY